MCNPCELIMSQAIPGEAAEEGGIDEYPPEIMQEFSRLSAAIYGLVDKYQDQVLVKIWDPRSLQGLIKSIRFNVHRYPTFIINGQLKLVGWDEVKLDQQIRYVLGSRISAI